MLHSDLVVKFTNRDIYHTEEENLVHGFNTKCYIDEVKEASNKIDEIKFQDDEDVIPINEYYNVVEIISFDTEYFLKIYNSFNSYIITQVIIKNQDNNIDLKDIKAVYLLGYKYIDTNLWHLYINLP